MKILMPRAKIPYRSASPSLPVNFSMIKLLIIRVPQEHRRSGQIPKSPRLGICQQQNVDRGKSATRLSISQLFPLASRHHRYPHLYYVKSLKRLKNKEEIEKEKVRRKRDRWPGKRRRFVDTPCLCPYPSPSWPYDSPWSMIFRTRAGLWRPRGRFVRSSPNRLSK